jgi:hypothetical protein
MARGVCGDFNYRAEHIAPLTDSAERFTAIRDSSANGPRKFSETSAAFLASHSSNEHHFDHHHPSACIWRRGRILLRWPYGRERDWRGIADRADRLSPDGEAGLVDRRRELANSLFRSVPRSCLFLAPNERASLARVQARHTKILTSGRTLTLGRALDRLPFVSPPAYCGTPGTPVRDVHLVAS